MMKKSDKKTEVVKVDLKPDLKPEAAPKAPPAAPKPSGYEVAPGKSFTSLKGILGPGDKVLPKYFNGGEADFQKWVERGYLVKSK